MCEENQNNQNRPDKPKDQPSNTGLAVPGILSAIATVIAVVLKILGEAVFIVWTVLKFLFDQVAYIVQQYPKESLGFLLGSALVASVWLFGWIGCSTSEPEFVEVYYADVAKVPEGGIIAIRSGPLGLKKKLVYLADVGVPSLTEPFGSDAQKFVQSMVAGRRICVKRKAYQPEGSGIVFLLNGDCVQQRLVRMGYAYCRGKLWRDEEKQAKSEKLGIWSVRGFTGQEDEPQPSENKQPSSGI